MRDNSRESSQDVLALPALARGQGPSWCVRGWRRQSTRVLLSSLVFEKLWAISGSKYVLVLVESSFSNRNFLPILCLTATILSWNIPYLDPNNSHLGSNNSHSGSTVTAITAPRVGTHAGLNNNPGWNPFQLKLLVLLTWEHLSHYI